MMIHIRSLYRQSDNIDLYCCTYSGPSPATFSKCTASSGHSLCRAQKYAPDNKDENRVTTTVNPCNDSRIATWRLLTVSEKQ